SGQAERAVPRLRQLEKERGESAAVEQVVAAGEAVLGKLDGVDRALRRATQLMPGNRPLGDLTQRVSKLVELVPPAFVSGGRRLRVDDVLDGWRLVQLLGEGGQGQIFAAERDGQKRAVKVLHAELSGNRAFEEQFKQEIVALAGLRELAHLVRYD